MAQPLDKSIEVGVAGAGAMGAGIAQVAAAAGHPVALFDIGESVVEQAIVQIGRRFDRLVEKDRMTASDADAAKARVRPARSLADLGTAGLVIEAVAERLDIKQSLFAEVEAAAGPEAILATNTSSLSIEAIAAGLVRPERVAGFHFFNPAPLMPLVEVISGLATDPKVADTLVATAGEWGKTPVSCKSGPGFIVNRVARPFYAEALRILEEGAADSGTIDAILRGAAGFRMGPFELMDMIGHDVNYTVTTSVFEAFSGDPRYRPSLLQKALVEAGRLGRKTGQGFYAHGPDAPDFVAEAQTAASAPSSVTIHGELEPTGTLLPLIEAGPVECRTGTPNGPGWIELAGDGVLTLSDGRMATERSAELEAPVVLFDLARDYGAATCVALTASEDCPESLIDEATGLFQALGFIVYRIGDMPGMVVLRTVAMLANEAADAVGRGVASPEDIDLAMRRGVNYPQGPLAWLDSLRAPFVLDVLNNLARAHGDGRHRAALGVQRAAFSGRRILAK